MMCFAGLEKGGLGGLLVEGLVVVVLLYELKRFWFCQEGTQLLDILLVSCVEEMVNLRQRNVQWYQYQLLVERWAGRGLAVMMI
jgi:hypothetical protein